jgi:hypothetical protein
MRHALPILLATLAWSPLASAQVADGAGAAQVVHQVNTMRTAAGHEPLARDGRLDRAARAHAVAMAKEGRLEHVLPGTGDPAERVGAEGVEVAELAQHVARGRDAQKALESLLASDGHRGQMLHAGLTHIGVAAVQTDDGVWLTQLLARIEPRVAPEPPPPAGWQAAPSAAAAPATAPAPAAAPAQPSAAAQAISTDEATPQVRVDAQGNRRIVGYWVQSEGHWWYYPRPADARSGQELVPDLSVKGPPPGVQETPAEPARPAPTSAAPASADGRQVRVTVRHRHGAQASAPAPQPAPAPRQVEHHDDYYDDYDDAYAGGYAGAAYGAAYGYPGMVHVVPSPWIWRRPVFMGPRVIMGPGVMMGGPVYHRGWGRAHPRVYHRGWGSRGYHPRARSFR